jgi:hypothetical protein
VVAAECQRRYANTATTAWNHLDFPLHAMKGIVFRDVLGNAWLHIEHDEIHVQLRGVDGVQRWYIGIVFDCQLRDVTLENAILAQRCGLRLRQREQQAEGSAGELVTAHAQRSCCCWR